MGRKDTGTGKPVEGKVVSKDRGPRYEGTQREDNSSNAGKHITQWRAGRGSI